jgi:hypothetical protein
LDPLLISVLMLAQCACPLGSLGRCARLLPSPYSPLYVFLCSSFADSYTFAAVLPCKPQEAILASEAEWSQHKKLIDFSSRPGGFRRALVSNLPYFMIQWDYKGEKGYGHVIEGMGDSSAKQGDGEDMGAVDEGDKGGGEFPRSLRHFLLFLSPRYPLITTPLPSSCRYFAAEIIGTILDLEPRKWRKPKFVNRKEDQPRIAKFLKSYAKFDWTGMLGGKK